MKSYKKSLVRIISAVLAFSLAANISAYNNSLSKYVYAQAATISSMTYFSAGDGPVITGSGVKNASYGFVMPVFNGGSSSWEDVADDLAVNIKVDGKWKNIDEVDSFVYNSNWGHWFDAGFTGYWFMVDQTTEVQLFSKSDSKVTLEYTLEFTKLKSDVIKSMAPTQGPELMADIKGGSGFTYPVFNGDASIKYEQVADDLKIFIRKSESDEWTDVDNNAASGWIYDKNFGQFWDGPGGYWFRIKETIFVRLQSVSSPDVYLDYTVKVNPDAPPEDPADFLPIELGSISNSDIDGWNMIWSDEFSGNSIDSSKWTHETGYYISDDPGTWGWGNNELEYYTDSDKNSFVKDGKLNLRLLNEPKSFEQDPDRTAPYSSGKLVSQNKFSFKYGRIDFCAKLPTGTGIWPALWMLPNDSVYGTWAASGEIDVMEARGRIDNSVCGTIHYGGTWPANTYTGEDYYFPEGTSYADGFHVYSCVWEKDKIRWYVDGQCYSVIPYTEWYSGAAPDNPYAPFDEEFYVILNLAAGGNFDGGKAPDSSAIPSEMQVEYVRVYQAEGDSSGTYTDHSESSSVPDKTDVSYVLKLQKYLLGMSSDGKGLDFDGDGKINITDFIKAKEYIISVI